MQRSYRWKPDNTKRVFECYNKYLPDALKNIFGNARRAYREKGKFPKWVTDDIRQKLLIHWEGEDFKKKSEQNRRNRLTEQVLGEGPTTHNTGRHSFYKKKKILVYFIFISFFYIILFYILRYLITLNFLIGATTRRTRYPRRPSRGNAQEEGHGSDCSKGPADTGPGYVQGGRYRGGTLAAYIGERDWEFCRKWLNSR